MNLANAKREFDEIVARYREDVPLDAAGHTQAAGDLAAAYKRARFEIDRFTAEQRGRRGRLLGRNTRNGLVSKLDTMRDRAAGVLGVG